MAQFPFLRPITREDPFRLCFVCLGNICRSPTAEGIFIHKVRERGLESFFLIDSAGTAAYHAGERANSKSQAVAHERGVHLPSIARRFDRGDLEEFDLILAMDSENHRDILRLDQEGSHAPKVWMMRAFDPLIGDDDLNGPGGPDRESPGMRNPDVPDPYYGGLKGFHDVFDILDRSCGELLRRLETCVVEV